MSNNPHTLTHNIRSIKQTVKSKCTYVLMCTCPGDHLVFYWYNYTEIFTLNTIHCFCMNNRKFQHK